MWQGMVKTSPAGRQGRTCTSTLSFDKRNWRSSISDKTMFFAVLLLYFCLLEGAQGTGNIMDLSCPPAFPSIRDHFQRTLDFPQMRALFDQMVDLANPLGNCSCQGALYEDFPQFNRQRCSSSNPLKVRCPVATTIPLQETTTVVATTQIDLQPGTTFISTNVDKHHNPASGGSPSVPPTRFTTTARTRTNNEQTTTTSALVQDQSTSTPPPPTTRGGGVIDASYPTQPVLLPVAQTSQSTLYMWIGIIGGVFLLVVIVGLLVACRKCLPACGGTLETQLQSEKLQRQKSDCQPITTLRQDTFENGAPKTQSFNGTIPKRRGGGSDTCVLLREDSAISTGSISSATGSDFHFNTLKALQHPHAMNFSGFGESSTDKTLTMHKKKKKKADKKGKKLSLEPKLSERSENETSFIVTGMPPTRSDVLDQNRHVKGTSDYGSEENFGLVPDTPEKKRRNSCDSRDTDATFLSCDTPATPMTDGPPPYDDYAYDNKSLDLAGDSDSIHKVKCSPESDQHSVSSRTPSDSPPDSGTGRDSEEVQGDWRAWGLSAQDEIAALNPQDQSTLQINADIHATPPLPPPAEFREPAVAVVHPTLKYTSSAPEQNVKPTVNGHSDPPLRTFKPNGTNSVKEETSNKPPVRKKLDMSKYGIFEQSQPGIHESQTLPRKPHHKKPPTQNGQEHKPGHKRSSSTDDMLDTCRWNGQATSTFQPKQAVKATSSYPVSATKL